MKTKTNVKAGVGPSGSGGINHNETVRGGIAVQSAVKAGGVMISDRRWTADDGQHPPAGMRLPHRPAP